MSNTKKINPETGKRLAKLIKKLNMTQVEFGEIIGLGSRQISCIVTGKRRLTEDNARRIAELFPPVRYEWLLGWDDYMTPRHIETENLIMKANDIRRAPYEHRRRLHLVADVLREMGYDLKPMIWNDSKILILYEHDRFLQKHMDEFLYFFTEDEIEKAYQRRNQQLHDEMPWFFSDPHSEIRFAEYYDADWIVDNKEQFITKMKNDAKTTSEVYNFRMNNQTKKFHVIDKETNEQYECT